jgi:plasmid stabilization system protein ParE
MIIHLSIGAADFGDAAARAAVRSLERDIEAIIDSSGLGEFDGDEFGGGEAVLYLYGPDADKLYGAIEGALRAVSLRPAHVILRYGDAGDPTARQRRIELE